MSRYILSRAGQAVLVLWIAFTITFLLLQALPGDAVLIKFQNPEFGLSPEQIADLREAYGVDSPLWVQYLQSLGNFLTGQFGYSVVGSVPVAQELLANLPATARLASLGFTVAVLLAVSLAFLATLAPFAWLRGAIQSIPSLFVAIPVFWLGIMLIQIFSFRLKWISVINPGEWEGLILPVLTLAVPISAPLAQILMRNIDEVSTQPFVAVARAKGASPGWVAVEACRGECAAPHPYHSRHLVRRTARRCRDHRDGIRAERYRRPHRALGPLPGHFRDPGHRRVLGCRLRPREPRGRPPLPRLRPAPAQVHRSHTMSSIGTLETLAPTKSVAFGRDLAARLRRIQPGLIVAWAVIAVVILFALFPGVFTSHNPVQGVPVEKLKAPSALHILGTDALGRDLFARIVYGAVHSLTGAFVAVTVGLVACTALGVIAGSTGGVVEEAVMRLVDVLLSIPGLLLMLSIIILLGFGTVNAAIAVGITSVAAFARLARSEVVRVRRSDYVEAAFGSGGTFFGVLLRHVLPNSLVSVLAFAALQFGGAILAISTLGFLGYGAPPPTPEWGLLIAEGRNYISTAWWLTTAPGIVVVLVVLAANRISRSLGRGR